MLYRENYQPSLPLLLLLNQSLSTEMRKQKWTTCSCTNQSLILTKSMKRYVISYTELFIRLHKNFKTLQEFCHLMVSKLKNLTKEMLMLLILSSLTGSLPTEIQISLAEYLFFTL